MFESAGELDPTVSAAYLSRLGVEPSAPTVEALRLLVQRHAERVPYETFWIPAGERWSTDPSAAASRIALEGRGGYCYHLNGALGLLLASLGYDVHAHVGGVQAGEPNPNAMGNHLVLTVTGLPSEENPAGRWYVDAGLGDALHEPLPLVAGTYVQDPFQLTLQPAVETGTETRGETAGEPADRAAGQGVADDRGVDAWTLTHDPAGGFRSMTWTADPALASDFLAQHEWLSTDPESGFVRVPMAERRDASGVDVIRGVVLSRVGTDAFTGDPITRESAWFEALADVFDLRFDRRPPEWRRELWDAVLTAHRAWETSQQS